MSWFLANLFFQCCCLLGWFVNRKQLPAKLNFIALMVLTTLLFELLAAYFWLVLKKNNLFIFHILVPAQYLLLALPYYFSSKGSGSKIAIITSILLVYAIALLLALTIQPINIYNTYTQLTAYVLLIIWSTLFLWNLLNDEAKISIERDPLFWISIGIIFYAVVNFVITGTLNYLITYSLYWAKILYSITTVVAFMMYSIFTFSFFSHKLFKGSYHVT